ncbi:gliding motility-associated ABC transporter permease protein GldF [Halolamina pelagica]|uniref:Gliding motility-associated ABC transporter permease protein GldF n=1 Tax=Halolamina pelagica TaxID=699431 RepID=A0A0P7I5H8_9EURY|nr:ABC transporter permease [Halolamina pelagica]KPN32273.1 gliding motility-associated ABC transporter permease protein GldF [Halolamina pelagica]
MSWEAVARKDFRDAVRSRWLWVLSALSILVFAGAAVGRLYVGGGNQQEAAALLRGFLFYLKQGTAIIIPLTALVVTYAAITRERESGTIKLLLSLPHSRDDVVLGKFLGRSAVVTLPVLIGFVVALLALLPAASGLDIFVYVQFALLTALLGVVFVGIGVGVSAAANTNQQALVGAGGLFAVFWFLWNFFVTGVNRAATDLFGLSTPDQFRLRLALKILNPIQAYKTLVDSLFMSDLEARIRMFSMLFGMIPNQQAAQALGPELSPAFGDAVVLAAMLLWLVLPLAVGIVWFREAEL